MTLDERWHLFWKKFNANSAVKNIDCSSWIEILCVVAILSLYEDRRTTEFFGKGKLFTLHREMFWFRLFIYFSVTVERNERGYKRDKKSNAPLNRTSCQIISLITRGTGQDRWTRKSKAQHKGTANVLSHLYPTPCKK